MGVIHRAQALVMAAKAAVQGHAAAPSERYTPSPNVGEGAGG